MGFKYAVIANCQARPINRAISILSGEQGVSVGTIITHLAKNQDEEGDLSILLEADLIFAQNVSNGYKVKHVVLDNLKREFPGKVVSWPNIFFTGQSPNLCYVTSSIGQRILGPLHEYHYKPILECWQRRSSVKDCFDFVSEGTSPAMLIERIEKSFIELKSREKALDVAISDVIEGMWRRNRLFFTFNHPSSSLLLKVASRAMNVAGILSLREVNADNFGEPLDKIIPPISAPDARILDFEFPTSLTSKGMEMDLSGQAIIYGKSRMYEIVELIESSYNAYDHQRSLLADVRFSAT